MEGAPSARQQALKARAGSHLGYRHLHLPLATTQLVEGACLIRRYRAVRSRGGQPRRDSSGGQSAPLITGRPGVRVPLSPQMAGSSAARAASLYLVNQSRVQSPPGQPIRREDYARETGSAHTQGAASSTAEQETFNLTVQGSIPWRPTHAPLAQRTAHLASNETAPGSNPGRRAHAPLE